MSEHEERYLYRDYIFYLHTYLCRLVHRRTRKQAWKPYQASKYGAKTQNRIELTACRLTLICFEKVAELNAGIALVGMLCAVEMKLKASKIVPEGVYTCASYVL